MAYYAIGIGGTGAKCLESLIHLAAAGMMPDDKELYTLFVDPDTSNGSRARVEKTLVNYVKCKDQLQLGNTNFLKTKVIPANPVLWTPFKSANPSLEDFFHSPIFKGSSAAKLFDVLYSKSEQDMPLEDGFRGHPSIGSAVMAKTVDLKGDKTWSWFSKVISNDPESKVFLAGSIFGGTGASGFPTIAQILKNNLPGVTLGGALILPYFKFEDADDGKLKARSAEFLMNTQTALKHYHLSNKTGSYDAVYLFGNESRTNVGNALGGGQQENAPHFIELYAALAAIDFFGKKPDQSDGKGGTQYFMTARKKVNALDWSDLPDGNNGDTVRSKILQLEHLAFAYLSVYHPTILDINKNIKAAYCAPWYVDFFERRKVGIDDTLLSTVGEYCKDFLLWIANIQGNCGVGEKINLIKNRYGAYSKKQNGSLVLKKSKDFSESDWLNKLWERMCNSRRKNGYSQGVGKFLHALYHNCPDKHN